MEKKANTKAKGVLTFIEVVACYTMFDVEIYFT